MGRNLGWGIQEFKEGLDTKGEPEKTEQQERPEPIEEGKDKEQAKTEA